MNAVKVINARAPVRINDIGGWTDTWFAERGKVINMAVYPWVEVQVRVFPNKPGRRERVLIHQENYGSSFAFTPGRMDESRNPMLEAAFSMLKIPAEYFLEVNVYSGVPAGAATGTSAAVSVSLLGALGRLSGAGWSAYDVAYQAHRLETELLKLQSGIQDQLCSALGGVNCIDMYQYPRAHVTPLNLADPVRLELENRLVLVFLGQGHHSSELHQKVIENLENLGPENPLLVKLRHLAGRGGESLIRGDLAAFGRVMTENTEVQRELHPELICAKADDIIGIAKEFNAAGWKVNGAGGNGGSLTLLADSHTARKREMVRAIEKSQRDVHIIPVFLSPRGLAVWEMQE